MKTMCNDWSWEKIAWNTYYQEPDYWLAATMVAALRGARRSGREECYKAIAFAGLKSRLIAQGQKVRKLGLDVLRTPE